MWVRQFSRDRGRIYKAEARYGRGRLLEAEAEYSRPRQGSQKTM